MRTILIVAVCAVMACFVSSCGSSWNVSGNNIVINKVEKDTVVPAGTLVIYPDSLR